MIKNSKFIDFPTLSDICQMHQNGKTEALEFWCEFFDLFSVQTLNDALDQLDSQFIKTIWDNKNYVDEKKSLQKEITKLENARKLSLKKIFLALPVRDDLIDSHIKEIKQYHREQSQLENISNVSLVKDASVDFIEISCKPTRSREIFMCQEYKLRITSPTDYGMSDFENRHLYEHLTSNLKSQYHVVNSDFLLNKIKEMKDDGFNPDVIFIPVRIASEIEKQSTYSGPHCN